MKLLFVAEKFYLYYSLEKIVLFYKQANFFNYFHKVLDLGFNGIISLPNDAFKKNKYLTLLALDGNPLPTIPLEAFLHLNGTLRGLSMGGKLLDLYETIFAHKILF